MLAAGVAAAPVFRVACGGWECPWVGGAGHDVAGGARVGAAADGALYRVGWWCKLRNTKEERTLTDSRTDYYLVF
jgi:hypothetical protein